MISRVATRLLHSTSPVSAQKNSIVGFRQGFDNLFDNFFGKDVASALSPSLHDSDFFSHWPHLTNTSLKWDLVEVREQSPAIMPCWREIHEFADSHGDVVLIGPLVVRRNRIASKSRQIYLGLRRKK